MSILDITEDKIFQTLGKGRDPNFKPIEKERPFIEKKPFSEKKLIAEITEPIIEKKHFVNEKPIIESDSYPIVSKNHTPQYDDSLIELSVHFIELNKDINNIQETVKWYLIPQSMAIVVMVFAAVLILGFN